MSKRLIKCSALFVSIMMMWLLVIGCNSNKQSDVKDTSNASALESSSITETSTTSSSSTLPLTTTPVTLTYFCDLNPNVAAQSADLGETELYKELEKRTGVKIKFIHPPAGQSDEKFNLMLASGEYPDIIERNWVSFPGGPEKAIKDNVIIKLNDLLDEYAPNLTEVLSSNPEWDKAVKTDNGTYYVFPYLRGDKWLQTYGGFLYRGDWLDELGLAVPETIDEFEAIVREFKEKKGATSGFCIHIGWFNLSEAISGSYGIARKYYQVDGKVFFGAVQPQYKDFLTTMNRWYKEGIIDPDFAVYDASTYDSKVCTGKTGTIVGAAGSAQGKYQKLMRVENPNVTFVAGPYLVLKKGDKPVIGQMDNAYSGAYCAAISTQCKEKELAMKWLDYGYGNEGSMLFNFGIEGVSYTMENGYPKYTDIITNNPDKRPMGEVMAQYLRSIYSGPFIQDKREYEQYLEYPEQKAAITIWAAAENLIRMPSVAPTMEESQIYASIQNDINTYVDEMYFKFIMGNEPLSNFDKYVEQVNKIGLQQAIDIQQAALERYLKR